MDGRKRQVQEMVKVLLGLTGPNRMMPPMHRRWRSVMPIPGKNNLHMSRMHT